MDEAALRQADAAAVAVRELLGEAVLAVYLYGSATMAGLRKDSDIDVFVLTDRTMTNAQRLELAERLVPLSGRWRAPGPRGLRPLEVTIVARPDIEPWRYPGIRDFQYGEWLREDATAGRANLGPTEDADVGLLITMVRQFGHAVVGPSASALLPEIPAQDLHAALHATVEAVLPGLHHDDTTNGVLTLARVWHTLATGKFISKDDAAKWAMARLPEELCAPLARATRVYQGLEAEPRPRDDTLATADAMITVISTYPEPA